MPAYRLLAVTAVLTVAAATPAVAATNTVPVKLSLTGCDQCDVTATWSKSGKVNSNFKSKIKTAKGAQDTVTFKVPKGYWLYFAATSPNATVDAATLMVTRYVGKKQGAKVDLQQAQKGTKGAYICLVAAKGTVKATAGIVTVKGTPLLALWASPQLAGKGLMLPAKQGIKGVYGTQNTVPCQGPG